MALLADLVNPLLVVLVIVAPLVARRRGRLATPPWRLWLGTFAGLLVVYAVTWLDRRFGWWASMGLDFSTHTAFAVTTATTLVVLDRRWLLVVAPLLVVYASLMVDLGYHPPADILTSAPFGVPGVLVAARRPT